VSQWNPTVTILVCWAWRAWPCLAALIGAHRPGTCLVKVWRCKRSWQVLHNCTPHWCQPGVVVMFSASQAGACCFDWCCVTGTSATQPLQGLHLWLSPLCGLLILSLHLDMRSSLQMAFLLWWHGR
jgi:hypothetical protein